ncbi:hypothetical protein [Mycoplasmopsis agassizii]|uniref:Lipoprotein-associated type-17 domain-containing protein n=1 Tax=Mycoplasmopsis agassizii TaxID=33922 RepID=A0ABX4H4Z1_9BACT|nr:hypothetical protein [Mycoplasmopsis agassizii]PAF54963.1 hypothetical protein CJF60_04485 [Mycoplasmopsis agassizii]SMC16959.1 hypothetical protein SAMN02745179_00355 [Mycoplasmopsis agassizii]
MKKTKKLFLSFAVLAGIGATAAAVACSTSVVEKTKSENDNKLTSTTTPVAVSELVKEPKVETNKVEKPSTEVSKTSVEQPEINNVEVKVEPAVQESSVSVNEQKQDSEESSKTKEIHHHLESGDHSEEDWTEETKKATEEWNKVENGLLDIFGSEKTIYLKDYKLTTREFIKQNKTKSFSYQLEWLLANTTLTSAQKNKVKELLKTKILNSPIAKNFYLVEKKDSVEIVLRLLYAVDFKQFNLELVVSGYVDQPKKVVKRETVSKPQAETQVNVKEETTKEKVEPQTTTAKPAPSQKDSKKHEEEKGMGISISYVKPVDNTPIGAIPLPPEPDPNTRKSIYENHPLDFVYLPNGNHQLVASLAVNLDNLAKAKIIRLKSGKTPKQYFEWFSKLHPSDSLVNLFDEHSLDFNRREEATPSFSHYGYLIAKTNVKNVEWKWNQKVVSQSLSVSFTLNYNNKDVKYNFTFITQDNKLDELDDVMFDLSSRYEVRQPGIEGEKDTAGNYYRSARAVSNKINVYEFMTKFSRDRNLQNNMTMLGDFFANASLTNEQWKVVRLIQSVPITGSALEFSEAGGNTTNTFDIVLRYGRDNKVFRLKVKVTPTKHWYSRNIEPLFNYVDFEILKEFIFKVNQRMVLKRRTANEQADRSKLQRDKPWDYISFLFTINTPHEGRVEDIFRPTSKNFDPKPEPTSWNPISIIKNMHIKSVRYYKTEGSHEILRLNPYFTYKSGRKNSAYAHMGQNLFIIVDRWQEDGPDIRYWS